MMARRCLGVFGTAKSSAKKEALVDLSSYDATVNPFSASG